MYERFYHLRAKPFALTPDPAFLYLTKRHQHALTMLEYVLGEDSGFGVITGEVGCGKTIVVRHFLEKVARVLRVGFVTNTHPGLGALLPWIMEALGIEPGPSSPSELYHRFVEFARGEHAAGRRVVLVIDEAQNLDMPCLEELRVLSNVNAGKVMLVQTILVGQPELRDTLRLQSLRQFAQRIVIDHHIEALRRDETEGYVRHRIYVAGGSPDLFAPQALELVHESSGGVPRIINILCDTALVYGFADQRASIQPEIIQQVLQDRASGGLLALNVPGTTTSKLESFAAG
jgi:type II secretory pathway predicted ATPase ExeA